ncbi:MAG: FGGY family carbohydrate kinase [Acidimicrobiales bacterium]
MEIVLALDAGTSAVRTLAFDQRARVIDAASRDLPASFPHPGEVEQDATLIASLAVATLREVAGRRGPRDRVRALGITNQRETTIAFDRATGRPGGPALVWQDRRTTPLCAALEAQGHGPAVRATTGLVLDPYFSASKMRWMADHGWLDSLTTPGLATVDAWLVWWLTGGPVGGTWATEPSNASRTALLDLATRQWSPAMTDLFAVSRAALPDLRPSAGSFGAVSAAVVPELAGVEITAVLGDQQAALFGQACFEAGTVKATYGTGSFVLANAGERPSDVDGLITTVAWDLGERGPVTYALEGSAFVAGAAVQWLRDDLGLIDAADELEPLARRVSDSGGACVVPAFTGLGSPFWRPEARGTLTGLSRGTSRAHLARALIEALAFQVRAMTDAFAAGAVAPREIRADGGAAAMDLLLEYQSTASRLPVRRSRSLEATARGAATLAGLVAGVWGSTQELADLWEGETPVGGDPTASNAAAVERGYTAWRRAVDRTTNPPTHDDPGGPP